MTRLASASHDHTVKIWDPASGQCVWTLEGHTDVVWSIAWSHETTRLASASGDRTVKIWDPATGQCMSSLESGPRVYDIEFDASNSDLLRTELGTSDLHTVANPTASGPASTHSLAQIAIGYGLSGDGAWITYQENLLWLPPEYRLSCSAIFGTNVTISSPSGAVLIFEFSDSSPI